MLFCLSCLAWALCCAVCVCACVQPSFHTPEALQQRAALEYDDVVVEAIQKFWGNFELSAHNEAGHDEYVRVMLLIMRSVMCVLMPPFVSVEHPTADRRGARIVLSHAACSCLFASPLLLDPGATVAASCG